MAFSRVILFGEGGCDDETVSGILIGKRVAGAGHDNNCFLGSVREEFVHADSGLFENDAVGDKILFPVVSEGLVYMKMVEVFENCRGMADDEKFVVEGLIDAGDGGGDGELAVDELDAGDGGFEVDTGDFKSWIACGIGERSGLEADEKINRKHNCKESRGEDLDEALRPAKRVEVATMRYEKYL